MLSENLLEPKQDDAIARLFAFDETILIAPTGAGKTIICLSAVKELIEACGQKSHRFVSRQGRTRLEEGGS